MDRRYVIALVLMGLVMIGWIYLQTKIAPPGVRGKWAGERAVQQEVKPKPQPQVESVEISKPPPGKSRREGKIVTVETDLYTAKFDTKDATAISWKLKKYRKKHSQTAEPIDLIPFSAIYCLEMEFEDPSLQWLAAEGTWEADKNELVLTDQNPTDMLTFTSKLGDLLIVKKVLTFHRGSYTVDMEIKFENLSDKPFDRLASGYSLKWGPGISCDSKKSMRRYGPKSYMIKQKQGRKPSLLLWVALNSRYFAAAIIPDQFLNTAYKVRKVTTSEQIKPMYVQSPEDLVELEVTGITLGPKEVKSNRFRLFVGPKVRSILKKVEAPENPESGKPIYSVRLDQLINFGYFGPLSKIMLSILLFFHKLVRNYGVAIILLTILINIILYPLTIKRIKSAREMQVLQPKIAKLRERYRDDPQKMNKELMKLYKEHGINPMSGCWPMLLQLPIFWALFNMLREAIELRGAHFILWIRDLSEPDTLGMIPGIGIPIRVLPILMGISMFYQQKISTASTDPQQAKYMKYMPLIFTFIFFSLPSGLVLYWLTSNLLTILQQYLMSGWSLGKESKEVS
ncbi:TPA: membrane protein insertase YidC [Candidatus Poribacteria bacterium]|nr:membrane protein insertase YidC [Candidatus Poribacteria bacterium]HEX29468.1 membrane protein insertase YidC [Candidatus Poribacteria bacterium]